MPALPVMFAMILVFASIIATVFPVFFSFLFSFLPFLFVRLPFPMSLSPGTTFLPLNPLVIVVPIPVMASGYPHQGAGNTAHLDPLEASLGPAGAVPAVGPSAPIPAVVEENLFLEPLHHLDARFHNHQSWGSGEADLDVNIHLPMGERR